MANLVAPFFDHALFIVEPFDRTKNQGDTVPVRRWPELKASLEKTLRALTKQGVFVVPETRIRDTPPPLTCRH